MKKFYLFFIFLICLNQVAFTQTSGFWMGTFINSSESSNFRVLVNNYIYKIQDTTWIKDVPSSPPILGQYDNYVATDIDSSNNIWFFSKKVIYEWNRKDLKWDFISNTPTSIIFGKILGKYIYCANYVTIYRADYTKSTISWQEVYTNTAGSIEDFFAHGKYIYVADYNFKVLRADTDSLNYINILSTSSSPASVIATDSIICVGTYWNGVYSSCDNGNTWVNGSGLPSGRGAEIIKIINEDKIYALQIDQMENTGWYYSNDKGKSFVMLTNLGSPWTIFQIRGIEFSDNHVYVNAGYRGFYKSDDNGKIWTSVNHGYDDCKPHNIKKIITTPDNEIIALSSVGGNPTPWYMATWGIFYSKDNGLTWDELSQNLKPNYMIIEDMIEADSGNLVVAPYDPGIIYILKKGDTIWDKINVSSSIQNNTSYSGSTIGVLANGVGDTIFAGTYHDGILRSPDGGKSWDGLSFGVGGAKVDYISTNHQIVLLISSGNGTYYSDNSGDTWQKINDNEISFIGIKYYKGLLFAYTSSRIYESDDMGNTWTDISGNLPTDININDIDIEGPNLVTKEAQENVDGTIFIASNLGVYQKTINNNSWSKTENSQSNCISYSKTSKQIFFGGNENVNKENYDATAVINFNDPNTVSPFKMYYSSQNDIIEVDNKSTTEHIKSASLYNNTGQKLMGQGEADHFRFNVRGFPTGLYIIQISYDGGNYFSRKLLITR